MMSTSVFSTISTIAHGCCLIAKSYIEAVFVFVSFTMVMQDPVYFRIFGYVATLAMHLSTARDVINRLEVTTRDPVVKEFATLQDRFMTIWTFGFQIAYASLGLTCDLSSLVIGKKHSIIRSLGSIREYLLTALLWPTTLLIFAIFWPFYIYDPNLVFPTFIDKILSPSNNHVMHTGILGLVIWDLIFLPRSRNRSHTWNLTGLFIYFVSYVVVLIATYMMKGVWVYPILKLTQGTIYFPIIFLLGITYLLLFYYIQWPFYTYIWDDQKQRKKNL